MRPFGETKTKATRGELMLKVDNTISLWRFVISNKQIWDQTISTGSRLSSALGPTTALILVFHYRIPDSDQ